MADQIRNNALSNLEEALASPLTFKIPVRDQKWVDMYPNELCLGRTEYGYCVDVWLERLWSFSSETAVTALDQMWVTIISACLNNVVQFLNQHDPSSAVRRRPDTTLMCNNALLVKAEAKLNASDMEAAKEQLRTSFFSGAQRCLPRSSMACLGITTCSTGAEMYKICFVNGRFSLALYKGYNLHLVPGSRVAFIVDIFKAMRWMASVDGPVSAFHLVPSVRRQTRNLHHVTWCSEGILKEYRNPRSHVIERILAVYSHRLPHVEWGHAVSGDGNAIMITRVAMRLMDAISSNTITRNTAVDHVRMGMAELHAVGYAHCDIVLENVFVDNGVAFLDDLEYLTPVDQAAPNNARWDSKNHPGLTARGLDMLLIDSLAIEVLRA